MLEADVGVVRALPDGVAHEGAKEVERQSR